MKMMSKIIQPLTDGNRYWVRPDGPNVIVEVWAAEGSMRGNAPAHIVVRDWTFLGYLEGENLDREVCEEVRRVMAELDQQPF